MFIQGVRHPLNHLDNFKTTANLCKLCYSDPFTVAHNISNNFILHRYLTIKDLIIYVFINKDIYFVFSKPFNNISLQELSNNYTYEQCVEKVETVVNYLGSEVYLLGHSVGAVYANNVANKLNYPCITIGELNLENENKKNNINKVGFRRCEDILATKDSILVNNQNTKTTLVQGIIYNSIDSYFDIANNLQDLKEEEKIDLAVGF